MLKDWDMDDLRRQSSPIHFHVPGAVSPPLLYTTLFTVHELCLTFHSQIFIFGAKFRAVFWKMSKSRLWPIKRLLGHLKSLRAGLESSIYFGWWEVTIISCHSTPSYSYKWKKQQPAAQMHFYWNRASNVLQSSGGRVTSTIPELKVCVLRPEKQFPSYEYERDAPKHGPSELVALLHATSARTTE